MRGLTVTFALCLAVKWGAVHAQVAKTAADGFCKSITHCGGAEKDVTCVCHSGCSKHDGTPIAQCQSSADCADDRACVGQRCVDPCAGQCGQNTECHVTDHAHYCRCSEGFTGDPRAGCTQAEPEACLSHNHCAEDQACVDNVCIDPCELANCGYEFACEVIDHHITCIAPQYSSLNSVGCKSDEECSSESVCVADKCVNPCSFGLCAEGDDCSVSNHEVFCLSNYYSSAPIPFPCNSDNDCQSDKKCENGACIDPCAKGWCYYPNICQVKNHSMICQTECIPPEKKDECKWDFDCPPNKRCNGEKGKCVNPCLDPDECGPDATCSVVSHVTLCIPKDKDKIRCKNNEHCPANKQCDGQECVNPCKNQTCDPGVVCKVVNHTAVCDDKEKEKRECSKDSECPEDKACRSDKCVDPCTTSKCDEEATCEVKDHKPVCKKIVEPITSNCTTSKDCPPDRICDGLWCIDTCECKPCGIENTCTIVDNKLTCTRITPEGECKTNEDCPADKKCNGLACVDPCSLSKELCKEHQQCKTENHEPVCRNKPDRECSTDEECADDKTCVSWKCVDPCRDNSCRSNFVCEALSHVAVCKPKPDERVKCSSNSDCVSERMCLQGHCEDPCTKFCKVGASCKAVDHVYDCGKGGNLKSGNCSGTLFPKPVGSKRYYAITDVKTNWWGAFMWCAAHGKQLATVESKEENKQILKVIEETKVRNSKFYVGGTDAGFEKHWMWMPTGLPIVKFSYWHPNRPGYLIPWDCLMYYEWPGSSGYRWYDELCTALPTHHFICQDYHK